jgi:modulator of FtsH protease HflK
VVESFRDVQRASTDADRMRNEAQSYANDIVPRARGDAARITAAADATRQATVAEATGQAQRLDSVVQAYQASPDVTLRRLYLETMQQVMSRAQTTILDGRAANVLPLLPLGNMAGQAQPAPPQPAPLQPALPPPAPVAPAAPASQTPGPEASQ